MAICSDLDKLDPAFRKKVELWLSENPEVFITESWRSYARQLSLYAQGRWEDGRIVTWTLKSMHQLGLAVDVAFEGKELYPKDWAKWRNLADSAQKFGIRWGYDLWRVDKPHFQDDGTPLNPFLMPIPAWAQPAVDDMKAAGIQTDPHETVGGMKLFHLLAVIRKLIIFLRK